MNVKLIKPAYTRTVFKVFMSKIIHNKYLVIAMLSMIVASGAILRFHCLGLNSIWGDEVGSRNTATVPYHSLLANLKNDTHPPAYFLFLSMTIKLFGDSEMVLRLPSVIAGILSIIAMFFLGRRLYTDKEGLIAAAFTAVLWFPVYYSMEARMYMFLMLFTILTFYFWIPLIKSASSDFQFPYRDAFCYLIAALLNSYTHYFGTLVVILQCFTMLWISRKSAKKLCFSFVLTGLLFVLFLPWIPYLNYQFCHTLYAIEWMNIPRSLFFFDFLFFAFNEYTPFYVFVLAMYLYFFFKFVRAALRQKDYGHKLSIHDPDFFLLYWLAVPYIIVYVKSIVSFPVLTHRYLIVIFPAACLILARALTLLPLRNIYIAAISCIIAYAFLFHLVFIKQYYLIPTKMQARETVKILSTYQPLLHNAPVIFYAPNWYSALDYYFYRFSVKKDYFATQWSDEDVTKITKMIQQNKPEYIWLLSLRWFTNCDLKFAAYFKKDKILVNKELIGYNVKLIKLTYPR